MRKTSIDPHINTISVEIILDRTSDIPLNRQLADAFIRLMEQGIYLPDSKLPAIRKVAELLDINPSTVVSAYRQLSEQGYIVHKRGSSAIVRQRITRVVMPSIETLTDEMYNIDDVELMKQGSILLDKNIINLASTSPDIAFISMDDMRQAVLKTLSVDGAGVFGYQESSGHPELREMVANLHVADKLPSSANEIQIISGAQQGLDIIAKALLGSDDTVITEAPTYAGAIAVFRSRGVRTAGVPLTEDGMDMDALVRVLQRYRPKLVYVVPAYQNPTGVVWSVAKKKRLLELAQAFGFLIIEDDYLREMTYQGKPPSTIKSMDTNDCVIFVKSYSKLLAPGVRVGYMAVPKRLQNTIAHAKHATDIFTSGLLQHMFMVLLRDGLWSDHMNRVLPVFYSRWKVMQQAIQTYLAPKGVTWTAQNGGLSVWLKIPKSMPVHVLYHRAQAKGVLMVSGSIFSAEGHDADDCIRLGFGQADEEAITKGIMLLAECLEREG